MTITPEKLERLESHYQECLDSPWSDQVDSWGRVIDEAFPSLSATIREQWAREKKLLRENNNLARQYVKRLAEIEKLKKEVSKLCIENHSLISQLVQPPEETE